MNILLLGSDARDSEENLDLGGARDTAGNPPIADVQMLLHVSADRSNMTVISIPRDTRVTIPKCTDPETEQEYPLVESDTINHSLQRGGPGCTVATWEELTGIPIDHFMMLDFTGVVSMADAVGGVPVCVNANVKDRKSGLELPKGESVVKGEQALQWLRTRHGFENGSDVGRTKAQHMYLSAMVRQLQAGTKLTDPTKLNTLANAATKALTVDPGLGSVTKLYDLGEDLRRVPNERINMITMPWIPAPENPTAHIAPEPGAAEELFSLVREDVALDADELPEPDEDEEKPEPEESTGPEADPAESIELAVRNGTASVTLGPVGGRAGAITEELQTLGFAQAVVDDWLMSQNKTTLLYPSGDDQLRANAEVVAEALELPKSAIRTAPSAERLTLIVGNDWREGPRFPEQPEPDENAEPEERLDPSKALKGDDDSACMDVNPIHSPP
jgi:LCP family protein required for cell wall assembly